MSPTSTPSGWKHIQTFLGQKRSMVGLLGMIVLVGMGEHMAERFLPLYLQELTSRVTLNVSRKVLSSSPGRLSEK